MPPQSAAVMQRRSLEVWSVWALIGILMVSTVIVTPFLSVALSTTKTFLIAAGAIIVLVLFIVARLSRGNIVFPPLMLVGALWLPTAAYALSSIFSGAPFANALWGSAIESDTLGFMLAAAFLGTLTALILRNAEQYKTFIRAGAATFVAVVLVQALIVIVGQFYPSTVSPSTPLVGSFQDLALFLGLGVIGVLITLRFVELKKRARQMLSFIMVVALLLLAVANVPFVWILLVLVSLGLFLEAVMMRKHSAEEADLSDVAIMNETSVIAEGGNRSITLPLPVLAVAMFFLVGGTLSGALANALNISILSASPSWPSTLSLAQQTYTTAPLFGTGPGSFGVEWLKYRDPALNATVFWNTDFTTGIGFIPTSFVTTGLVGVLAWLAFIALFVVLGLRTLVVRTPQDAFVRYVAILSFISTVYLLLAAIFSLPNTVLIALAFVFAGLFASTTRFASGTSQRGIIFSRSPRLGFVIVFSLTLVMFASVVVAYSLVGRYLALNALTNASVAFSKNDIATASQKVADSIVFAPTAAAYQAQANIALVQLRQIAASNTTGKEKEAEEAFQAALTSGINAAITATRLAPSDYQHWLALGNLYAQAVPLKVAGAYESSKTAFEKAQALNPTSPSIRYVMAQLDIAHNDLKSAKEHLKGAIALKADYIDVIFLLSQLEVRDGNLYAALQAAEGAARLAKGDANIQFQAGVLHAAQPDYANAVERLKDAIAANPQFANAKYFLAAVYAKQLKFEDAVLQLKEVAALSADNATIVNPMIEKLNAKKNPFPADLLTPATPPIKETE